MKILIPLPQNDFDPSEAAIVWKALKNSGHKVCFATPRGTRAFADPIMVTGKGLGLLKYILMANTTALVAYHEMEQSSEF